MSAPSSVDEARSLGTASELATMLEAAAQAYPEVCAVRGDDAEFTYRELLDRAREIADRLANHGVGPGSVVGIHLPRSAETYAFIHGIVASGAVAAPLDASDSPQRVAALIGQAGLTHVVCAPGAVTQGLSIHDLGGGPVLAETGWSDISERTQLAEPGYLLFTSGSTGLPKGVLLSAAGVAHFARWAARSVGLSVGDRVGAQAALTFDLSTFDLFATTAVGATAVILPDWMKAFPADTADWLIANGITVIYGVPTLLRGIVDASVAGQRVYQHLRTIIFAGEPYPSKPLAELLVTFPHARIRNWYGPTETNVCTAADVLQWNPARPLSIGTRIDDVHVAVVDADLQPGTSGEIVVAGVTVLTGYVIGGRIVDPTTEVMFPDGVPRRAYRTGDRASIDSDGNLLLHGRVDRQVKRRGYRIDLTGMEAIAADCGQVAGAAAVCCGGANNIVLFLDASGADRDRVERALRDQLPSTSQPDRIVLRAPLPTNQRGKVDYPELVRLAAHHLNNQENAR